MPKNSNKHEKTESSFRELANCGTKNAIDKCITQQKVIKSSTFIR